MSDGERRGGGGGLGLAAAAAALSTIARVAVAQEPSALAQPRTPHPPLLPPFAPTPALCAELETLGFRDLAVLSRGVDTWQFHPARRSGDLRLKWNAAPDNPVVLHAGRMAAEVLVSREWLLNHSCLRAPRAGAFAPSICQA